MSLLDFCITQILTSTTVIIECISWLINITDINDARWKPEIVFNILVFLKIKTAFFFLYFICNCVKDETVMKWTWAVVAF